MATVPRTLSKLLLTGFHIAGNPEDQTLKGLILQSEHGEARFLLTRQQLLELADAMPKPPKGCRALHDPESATNERSCQHRVSVGFRCTRFCLPRERPSDGCATRDAAAGNLASCCNGGVN
jgi:hypothetical protein